MSAAHDHDHAAHNERKSGPAKIATVERRYAGTLASRFRGIKGKIRTKVDAEDAFGLRDTRRDQALVGQAPEEFAFPDDSRKEAAFERWLQERFDADVLEPVSDDMLRRGRHYTGVYVRQGYGRGLRHGDRELRRAGLDVDEIDSRQAFNQPIHRDQLRQLYRRQFSGLEGITEATGKEISRRLSEGLIAGENPRTIARDLTDAVDDVGITRARTLARTELSRSYNAAAGRRYQQLGVEQVQILVTDPCPICESLRAGGPYPVEKAAGLLPAHPNCVCAVTPVVS